MKILVLLLTCSLLATNSVSAQEESLPRADSAGKTETNVLDRFVGKWTTVSQPASDSEIAPAPYKGTMEARMLGQFWMIGEYDADMGGTKFNAMQRLRFDAKQQTYVGTWVDSFFDYEWPLEGKMDGKRLIVNSEGPNPTKPGATSKFRDIYVFESDDLIKSTSEQQTEDGTWAAFMTGEFHRTNTAQKKSAKASQTTIMPFLMFIGKAEEAMNFYTSLFPEAKVKSVEKYGPGESGKEGTIKQARFELAGQKVMCIDSPDVHEFTFTPSFSFFVDCETQEQLDDLFAKLSADGKVMMPLNNYGFSQRFGWTSDQFGVSWQLNLPN